MWIDGDIPKLPNQHQDDFLINDKYLDNIYYILYLHVNHSCLTFYLLADHSFCQGERPNFVAWRIGHHARIHLIHGGSASLTPTNRDTTCPNSPIIQRNHETLSITKGYQDPWHFLKAFCTGWLRLMLPLHQISGCQNFGIHFGPRRFLFPQDTRITVITCCLFFPWRSLAKIRFGLVKDYLGMSTQMTKYIHHIIQLPETQDPNSSFTTAPGSAVLFDGAVGESPPADLSPGGASAPHWLGRAAPRDLLLQAEKAFLRMMCIHNLCRFSGHGLSWI